MEDIYFYSYVEDLPSASLAKRLVAYANTFRSRKILFFDGFPMVTGGYGAIKKRCPSFLKMASRGIYTFILTDLDTFPCAGSLMREWFSIPEDRPVSIPQETLFRIAVREVEAWVLADVETWSAHVKIPSNNFSRKPDALEDPKQHLLSVIQRKGSSALKMKMLPKGHAHVGPDYNNVLCDFIDCKWSPETASRYSPSLKRAINALICVK